jgi:uncharacterized Zn finger protein
MNNNLKLNVSLDKTIAITCEECGGQVFTEGVMLRKVSRFLTGQMQDGLVPIPVFACNSCNHVNEEFLPKELQKKED